METVISASVIGLSLGTQYALISIGFTLIFGIMGVVNFAHGGFYILGGYFAFSLSHGLGIPFVAAVVLAALATGVLGYVIEVLVVDRYVADHLATMLMTLGIYQIMTTGITLVYGAEPAEFRFPVSGSLRGPGFYIPYSNIIVLVVCTLAIAGIYYLVYKTRYGIALRAMADDGPVARAQGIPPATDVPNGLRHRNGAGRTYRRAGDTDPRARTPWWRGDSWQGLHHRHPRGPGQHHRRHDCRICRRHHRGLFQRVPWRIQRSSRAVRPRDADPARAPARAVGHRGAEGLIHGTEPSS